MEIANNPLSRVGSERSKRALGVYGAGFSVKVCLRELASDASLNGW